MRANVAKRFPSVKLAAAAILAAGSLAAQDPAEPPGGTPRGKPLPPPAGAISRKAVDEKSLRDTVEELVSCGTRHSLSSWEDSRRGIGCGRDKLVARLTEIARASGGKLAVSVDRFEATGPRTRDKPARLENVVALLPGSAGRDAVRLVFRLDRLGRGGDHRPFVEANLPAVRFTEPLENYDHEHQTPRVENGREYGDLVKFVSFEFLGNVARSNAEVLRQLALAPAPPAEVTVSGGVSPDAKLAWTAAEDFEREGFEILWRETTEPRWSVYDFAASAGESVLKGVSTDNHFFAVRSVGKNGARSIPAAALLKPPPPRKP